jgi:hypothetical protein
MREGVMRNGERRKFWGILGFGFGFLFFFFSTKGSERTKERGEEKRNRE